MNAEQRLEELFLGLSNYERTRAVTTPWSLDNMRALMAAVGVGEGLPGIWVQVGGSKGKGTTVLYLESMARAAGLHTGAFVSPHLSHVTERILLDGKPVDSGDLVVAMERVLGWAGDGELELSFFEAMTAAAVLLFGDAGCEFVALEVGLGGRLDATTAVPVDAAIITTIELEHADLLGDTVAAIATEKAHIMRTGKPCWVHPDPTLDGLFAEHARRVGAMVMSTARVVTTGDRGVGDGAGGDAAGGDVGELLVGDDVVPFRIEDASQFERPAFALAYSCLRHLIPAAKFDLDPVARPVLPGRFEVTMARDGRPLILDGAHTPSSSAQVAAELCRRFPHQPVVVLYASAAGKLWQEGLSELMCVADKFFVTALAATAGVDPGLVADWLRGQGKTASVVEGPAAGLSELSRCDAVRLVVGSFYLVGAVRSLTTEP